MNRILFFVHFNKYNGLADYVLYLLKHIKHIYRRVVFISNSPLSGEQQDKLALFYDDIILRENKGFDFGAWKEALLHEGWDALCQYDSVTLMNDTCFGPLFDLEPIYKNMEQKDIDFWGMTIHQAAKNGMPGTNKSIPEHIQSYFLCFNKAVVCSDIFMKFWYDVQNLNNVDKVIQLYETQLTILLSNNGFSYTAIYSPVFESNSENKDVATWHPHLTIQKNVPFTKIKSFIYFQHPKYILDLIQEKTNYPIDFIYDYITETFDPNTSIKICNKLIPAVNKTECTLTKKIAIHIHVFYLDIFEKYINYLNNMVFYFDLFITTDSQEKENQIKISIKDTLTEKKLKQTIITENRGRDILPWLGLADVLSEYNIVGHFHTKKTPTAKLRFSGEIWQHEMFELLLKPSNTIIAEFQNNERIGIIIPDIPYYWQIIYPYIYDKNNYGSLLKHLWQRMNCNKTIDFEKLSTTIMPYGTMFWYRPAALRPLFDLHLSINDFPPEPLAEDLTIAHCIERLLIYIVWNNGFDYRIMTSYPPKINAFMYNMLFADIHSDYQIIIKKIENSKSYRIGKLVLALPRFIKMFIKTYILDALQTIKE